MSVDASVRVMSGDERRANRRLAMTSAAAGLAAVLCFVTFGISGEAVVSAVFAATLVVLSAACGVVIGLVLPFTWLAKPLGFVALPWMYFVFLGGATATYLLVVEWAKRRLFGRKGRTAPTEEFR